MLKYNYKQGIVITEENGTPIKDFAVQMYINEEGIDEQTINEMLEMFSKAFTGLIGETDFPRDSDVQFDSYNGDIGKGWS